MIKDVTKRFFVLTVVLLGLVACSALEPVELALEAPEVISVAPQGGATEVPLDTAIRAELSLPRGALDVTTLSETSVTLSDQRGGSTVEITRALENDGRTLVLQPATPLQPNTSYFLRVTAELVDEMGTSVEPFESTFTTTDTATEPPEAPTLDALLVSNPLGIPFADRFVLHRIDNTSGNLCFPNPNPDCDNELEQWEDLEFLDTATVQLTNSGETPLQLSVTLSAPADFAFPNGENELSIAPGDSYELPVQFIRNQGEKGVFEGHLDFQSADGESTQVELAGIYMLRPEGNREVFLEGIVEAFGYTTDLGADDRGGLSSAGPDAPLAGDEVRSDYWERADSDAPAVVTQIAAFHGCCAAGDVFEAFYEGSSSPFISFRHERVDSNTIFPRIQGESEVARAEFEPSEPFEMRSAGYSTDPSRGVGNGNLGLRLWPAKDRDGQEISNTYIAAQDFVASGDCFTTPLSNCDFNDNMYLIENITPAD